jgi:NAD(P)-dependent dehydrogenase (short-subunit alcohol dehydrogenase family)
MQYSFKDKKVLVTGAGRGIGKDLVLALVKEGAIVYALSKNPANLATLKKECPGITTIPCDLSDWKATEQALEGLEAMDYLVNNAGVATKQSLLESTEEVFDKTFNVNVKSMINVTKIISKNMIAAGKQGSIVNVSSVSAVKATPGLMTYCATKASVDMLTKCMSLELAPHKIRVMSVNPTLVVTDMGLELWSDQIDDFKKSLPLGDFPTTESCTNAILFLLSDLSQYATGTALFLDSGLVTK